MKTRIVMRPSAMDGRELWWPERYSYKLVLFAAIVPSASFFAFMILAGESFPAAALLSVIISSFCFLPAHYCAWFSIPKDNSQFVSSSFFGDQTDPWWRFRCRSKREAEEAIRLYRERKNKR